MIAPIRPRNSLPDKDAQLMQQVRDGQQAAFEELYARNRAWVEGVLASTGTDRDPRDLAQEVFLRVFRARHSYRPEAKFSTWLFAIVTNVAKNSKRTVARRYAVRAVDCKAETTSLIQDAIVDHRTASPLPALLRSERTELVRQSISLLSKREQNALRSYHFQGRSCSQIAEEMHCSASAVKSLLLRARAKVRRRLQSYAESGQSPRTAT